MAESHAHLTYVRHIVNFIPTIVTDFASALLCADLPESEHQTTTTISGFYPDVYYHSLTDMVIGEAKTDGDIEREHTDLQIDSYIKELQTFDARKHLIFSTSSYSFALFHNKLLRLKRQHEIKDITFYVIDNFKRVSII